jgi:Ala-tRNA(Pro) deacylase
MELMNGRPENNEGRLDKEIRVYDFLDKLGVSFQRIDHEPAMTMEICAQIDKVLDATICKNLLLCNRQKTDFYLLMMPGDKVFKTKDLSNQIGSSRLSFAEPCFMEQFLDITPGSVSVMGLINDTQGRVRLLMDKDLLGEAEIGCHPCVNTSSVAFSMADLLEKLLPATGHRYTAVELLGE